MEITKFKKIGLKLFESLQCFSWHCQIYIEMHAWLISNDVAGPSASFHRM